MIEFKPGLCLYGGTMNSGVWLLFRHKVHASDRWYVVRVDHGWHWVNDYAFASSSVISEADINGTPKTAFGGWREIPRDAFDEKADEILGHIHFHWDAYKKENR